MRHLWFLPIIAVFLSPTSAVAQLVEESSRWHAAPEERPWGLQPSLSVEFKDPLGGQQGLQPDLVARLDLRGSWHATSWLSLEAGIGGHLGGAINILGGRDSSETKGWQADFGLIFSLPLRIAPYAGMRVGYMSRRVLWQDYSSTLFGGSGGHRGNGNDNITSTFLRAEGGVRFHISEAFILGVGLFIEVDIDRNFRRNISSSSETTFDITSNLTDIGYRRPGMQVSAQYHF